MASDSIYFMQCMTNVVGCHVVINCSKNLISMKMNLYFTFTSYKYVSIIRKYVGIICLVKLITLTSSCKFLFNCYISDFYVLMVPIKQELGLLFPTGGCYISTQPLVAIGHTHKFFT